MHTLRTSGFLAVFAFTLLATSATWATSTVIFKCADGVPGSLVASGARQLDDGELVCDGDGVRDRTCTFVGACPLCAYDTPPCLAPCTIDPSYVWVEVPAKGSERITVGDRLVIFRCAATRGRPSPPHHRLPMH